MALISINVDKLSATQEEIRLGSDGRRGRGRGSRKNSRRGRGSDRRRGSRRGGRRGSRRRG